MHDQGCNAVDKWLTLKCLLGTVQTRTNDFLLDHRDERVTSLVVYHGPQSFSCADCGKTVTRKGDLIRHIVSKVESNIFPFKKLIN